jgi:TM2 domain-containing membrane protein YozV
MTKAQKNELRGKFSQDLPQKTQRSRIIAAVLAIIFGGLGIHKFYLGQAGWGILYLIFAWTGIPWVIQL